MFPPPTHANIDMLKAYLKMLEHIAKFCWDYENMTGFSKHLGAFMTHTSLYIDILWLKWFIWRGKPVSIKRLKKLKNLRDHLTSQYDSIIY